MLNLFKLYYNKNTEKNKINPQEKHNKHYPSAVREWNNSIYVFNKNAINLIPQATELVNKLIKSYFNLYNLKLERKIRSNRLLRRLRKLSSNKIYVSNGEFKHTNNKVVITLYLFNRQKFNIDKKIRKGFYKVLSNQNVLNKRWLLIQEKAIQSFQKWNKKKFVLIDIMESYTKDKQIINYKDLSKYIIIFYKKLIKKSLDKYLLHKYYQQLVFINKSKFNYNYLQLLKKYIEKIYNKNVEFNLVNLRHFYLNSDILSESITIKIRKNRRKLLKYLNTLKRKVKVRNKKNIFYQPFLNKLNNIDKKYLEEVILKNIKYKHVTGFRLETKGRLTRRYTASRSVSKLRYKGNLLNIDSSYRGLSSVLLKGNQKSNLQHTKLKSKTRIGSFGTKGWISSN
jgi:Mitochondrial ribosomal protein (VAR1)